ERVERPSLKGAGLVVYGATSCGTLPFHIVAGGHLPDFREGRQVLDVSRVDNHDHILERARWPPACGGLRLEQGERIVRDDVRPRSQLVAEQFQGRLGPDS